ncbi:MAG: DUF1273 family protein [Clostridia bacterium]|nr:DUF1273 family protein [Clostridia bacterium]
MRSENKQYSCCFFGHRKIEQTPELIKRLTKEIESLIVHKSVDTFYFGNKSEFNSLCYKIVTCLKEKYPHIKRIYVRAAYPYISDEYKNYLLESYEDTYFPDGIENAGKASYVERNYNMIDKSQYCICYYDKNYLPPRRKNCKRDLFDYQPKSGTEIAYNFATKKELIVINIKS